jgi:hypothetical protein
VAEAKYLDARLSLVSLISVVGDVIGKGGKLAKRLGGEAAQRVLQALQRVDIVKFLDWFKTHPKLGPYVAQIQEAVGQWIDDVKGAVDAGESPTTLLGPHQAGPGSRIPPGEGTSGGRAPVHAGRAGKETASRAIGVDRNVGPGRVTVPGTGPGGFRIRDFPPEVTIRVRGSVVTSRSRVSRVSRSRRSSAISPPMLRAGARHSRPSPTRPRLFEVSSRISSRVAS